MGIKFSNNAATQLTGAAAPSATTISVADASDFPSLGSGEYTFVTLVGPPGLEVVKVTAISGSTMSVVRGQDGTSPKSYSSGDGVELRMSAALLREGLAEKSNLSHGTHVTANGIGASELKVSGNGSASQYLRSDGDGTFSWVVPPNTQLSNEQVQDIVGAMVSGNSESNITVAYNDGSGKLNFTVNGGAGSGLDADTLDGYQAADLLATTTEFYELYRDPSTQHLKFRTGHSLRELDNSAYDWWIGQGETLAVSGNGHLTMTL